MKYFEYYWYDSRRDECTIGVAIGNSVDEVRENLSKKYHDVDANNWEIREINLAQLGIVEIYYGG